MTSLKSFVRRGGTISAAALASLTLAACSAGHITQTSSQVATVDGQSANSENGELSVRDVTITVEDNAAALKFTATNQDPSMKAHTLESISVDGNQVSLGTLDPIEPGCSVFGDSALELKDTPQAEKACIQYIETTLDNDDYAPGGHRPVEFVFDSVTITVDAAIAAAPLTTGEHDRDWEEGYAPRGDGSISGDHGHGHDHSHGEGGHSEGGHH
ncbi:hypothetical protein QP912_08780 [Corynebacterium pseudodiphtheriticum]|uniref:hypothetical protein n=1 Tax=Corynebacterium pseudodiphtheriticum TaxID=37637 RepID=UPI00254CF92E|nr:hypothetical protein [Corynebacterium pseudodiphtheriticum]MDK8546581.1 hypothetical protein [Corynebacterium pseudodiphtheriticum]MDK8699813.1 hypothetical protein [Corynebacterium pseudodiphtheriticum]MDK8775502.1 hypothetical protein [Corynebacterium pseudodiphtheriticum]